MNTAYLVLGPAGSGTRLLTRVLLAGGCEGDPDHFQRWDDGIPPGVEKLVWRHALAPAGRIRGKINEDALRYMSSTDPFAKEPSDSSVEWAKRTYDLPKTVETLRGMDYLVRAVILTRDWQATVMAQIARGHAKDRLEAEEQIRRAYALIFAGLYDQDVPFVVTSYEALVLHPITAMDALLSELGLSRERDLDERVIDANAKHYEAGRA